MKLRKRSIVWIITAMVLIGGIINFVVKFEKSTENIITGNENNTEFAINEQGQTYGTPIIPSGPGEVGHEPDLIKTKGENGLVGYVKAQDLTPNFSSPKEALAQQETIKTVGYVSIPLYKSDGNTIIGEFRMHSSNED
ncbi:hypothetical protein PGC35_20145 [Psychrobacillus sp. PGGUH221]|uniref:hypothetical protein n=1 Tax=Psychrobacillus sp. PGGUH221 TaxID=3020058 RepID=UPI0035C70C96